MRGNMLQLLWGQFTAYVVRIGNNNHTEKLATGKNP